MSRILSTTILLVSTTILLLSFVSTSHAEDSNIEGSIRTLFNTSREIYRPHAIQRSRYAGDDITSFLVIASSAVMKISDDTTQPPGYDRKTVSWLAGHSVFKDYVDGIGTSSRFSIISDFTQSEDGRWVYISDQNNHCIRLYDRLENNVTTFAGKCKHPGSHTGPRLSARFRSPTGITMSNTYQEIYLTDRLNNRILRIDLKTEENYVQTVVDDYFDVHLRVILPVSISLSSNNEELFVSTDTGLYRYRNFSTGHDVLKSLVTQYSNSILDFALVNNDTKIIATDFRGNRLLVIDLINGGVGQICTGRLRVPYESKDGTAFNCEANSPHGISVIDESHVYVTEHVTELVRELTYSVKDLTTTSTTSSRTTAVISQSINTSPPSTVRVVTRTKSNKVTTSTARAQNTAHKERATPKPENPLVIGLAVGLTIPAILIGLLVALVIYLKRKSMKEAEAMWARRVAHGGYTGPAYEDESNFHRVLDSRIEASAPTPQYYEYGPPTNRPLPPYTKYS